MSKFNHNAKVALPCYVGTVSTAGDYPLCHLPAKFVLEGVKLLDQAGIAADNTNYVTLTVKTGSTAIASLDTREANQGAVTANTGKDFALNASYDGAEAEPLAAGDYKLTYAEGGTGTLTGAQVVLYGYFK